MTNTSPNLRRVYQALTAVLLLAAAAAWLQVLLSAHREPLAFDDAYMFVRYAHNIRHGLGLSWNLDGRHTYGPTSLLWAFCILIASYIPAGAWTQLVLASWICSVAAAFAAAWAVAKNSESELFRGSIPRVLPWVVVPLVATLGGPAIFAANSITGMETMLATALCALFCGMALLWRRNAVPCVWLGTVGFLLYLARPEAALVAVALPVLVYFLMPGPALPKSRLLTVLGVFFLLVALQLGACQLYFHTAFPLSVYMKGKHAYLGYRGVWHPELLLLEFFAAVQLYLGVLLLLARRADRRLLLCFLLPAVAIFAYLSTVTQIMGFHSRYYAPYAPLLIIPALLVLDRWLPSAAATELEQPTRSTGMRTAIVVALFAFLFVTGTDIAQRKIKHLEHRHREEYDAAQITIAATRPLPYLGWATAMQQVTDLLVARLPKGVTVAATEVGYLGEAAPQANILDIAGLNDTEIALHGFDLPAFLARKPDLIWMPNLDYTQQRGAMIADPTFLAQYDLYADAANYGLAVRKDSPYRTQIFTQMQTYWAAAYPGTHMQDYLVTQATWTGAHHTVFGE